MTTSQHDCRPGRAVVIGAGFAGLTAAAVLSAQFAEVIVIEQDQIAPSPAPRKSLPQANHAHALLHAGHAMLARLFPGFAARAVAAGSLRLQVRSQWRSCLRGRWTAPEDTGLSVLSQTRGLLDHLIRAELAACPGIRPLRGKVSGLAVDRRGQVCGVHLLGDDPATPLAAALVIDASGRAGQSDLWLARLGMPAPVTETAAPEVRYVSAEFSRAVTAGPDLAGWLNPAQSPQRRGGILAPVEQGRWIATASTRFGDDLPRDEAGFRAFLHGLPDPKLAALLMPERCLTGFSQYRVAATRLKRFDLAPRQMPPGYLPVGDVIASFNPVYGQGLSVAALQVEALATALRTVGRAEGWQSALRDLYLGQALRPALWAWQLGLAADHAFPEFTATPSPGAEDLRRALNRAFLVSTRSAEVRRAVDRSLHLVDPPDALFDLPVIAEALAPSARPPVVTPHERAF